MEYLVSLLAGGAGFWKYPSFPSEFGGEQACSGGDPLGVGREDAAVSVASSPLDLDRVVGPGLPLEDLETVGSVALMHVSDQSSIG